MEYQIIPIELFKRIEPWLINDIHFDRMLIDKELDLISDIYLLGDKKFPEETQNIFLSIKRNEKEIPYPNLGTDEEKHEFSLTVGKNLVLDSGTWNTDNIINLWNEHNRDENPEYQQIDQDVLYGILLVIALYYKHQQTNGLFDFEDFIINQEQMAYTYSIRPDMLRLYKLFHDKKKSKKNTITIEYNKQKIELTNDDEWFLNMITPYLDKYLGVPNLEEVTEELEKDYPTLGTRGRKKQSTIFDTVLLSIYNLLRHSSFAIKDKGLTNNEGEFILDVLKYLELIEEDSPKDDILNLRATIRNLQKYGVQPEWWKTVMSKSSSNNPFIESKSLW